MRRCLVGVALALTALAAPSAALADEVHISVRCPDHLLHRGLPECELNHGGEGQDPVFVNSTEGEMRVSLDSSCGTIDYDIRVDGRPPLRMTLTKSEVLGMDLGPVKIGRHQIAVFATVHEASQCLSGYATGQLALGTGPYPAFVLHATPNADAAPGDTIKYSGRRWTGDGPVTVRLGKKVLDRFDRRNFSGRFKYRAKPDDDCLTLLTVTQRIGGSKVSRTVPIGGHPVARVVYAENVTVRRKGKDGKLEPNTFVCRWEDEDVRLGKGAVFAGHPLGDAMVLGRGDPGAAGTLALLPTGLTVYSEPEKIHATGIVAPLIQFVRGTKVVPIAFDSPGPATCLGSCQEVPAGETGTLGIEGQMHAAGNVTVRGAATAKGGALYGDAGVTILGGLGGRGSIQTNGPLKLAGPVAITADDRMTLGSADRIILCGTAPACP